MKLSLAWIFDHIEADWSKLNIQELINKINGTTAEIESLKKITIDVNNFELAKIISIDEKIKVQSIGTNKEIILKNRLDAKIDDLFLIKKNEQYNWATLQDLGSEKDGLVPNLFIKDSKNWKLEIETTDYIFELDNKSITHRPDLWGHRGFAREIAAILNLKLKPIEGFLKTQNIIESQQKLQVSEIPFSFEIENSNACKRFAATYIPEIKIKPSSLFFASRLAKIDSKPINFIVDITNYVMFDISQPMHAFDANKIKSGKMGPRFAVKEEKITLLDNETITLSDKDLIIADTQKPIALAGIMGGLNTQIDDNTTSILLESACFDAATIRKSSTIHKKRTDASARFEKNLDPNQNTIAIERFLKLSEISISNPILSLGNKNDLKTIEVTHDFIEKRLGTKLTEDFVIKTLEKLEFNVKKIDLSKIVYEIVIPSWRITKDVTIPEDIVEEIGRFFGYKNIEFVLPYKQSKSNNLEETRRIRKIKQNLAYACNMHEVQNYPFFDEDFLKELNWQPEQSIEVANPVSENWRKLVNSLIPHILKNIQQNLLEPKELRFFELNNIWYTFDSGKPSLSMTDNNSLTSHPAMSGEAKSEAWKRLQGFERVHQSKVEEIKSLAGIFFDKKNNINFYDCKEYINNLFYNLGFCVQWEKPENNENKPWFAKYQTAQLKYENKTIGYAGMMAQNFLSKISEGNAFIFEINANFLIKNQKAQRIYKPISKYPTVWLDISLFAPLNITVNRINNIIKNSDNKINNVELIDVFENSNWKDKKSLTFRYYLIDENKTLEKAEIDEVINAVVNNLKQIGLEIR